MNPAFDRIIIDPAVMNGQPCIRGMRLTVKRVVRAMAAYPGREAHRRYRFLPLREALAHTVLRIDHLAARL